MKRVSLAVALLISFIAAPQAFAQANQNVPTFRAQSDLVVVDVVAVDKDGVPVKLSPDQFHVFENGVEQKISEVEHGGTAPSLPVSLAQPGWNDNREQQRTPASVGNTNIILLDSANMTPSDQLEGRNFVLRSLHELPGGERFMLFLLSGTLTQISGTTSDLAKVEELLKKTGVQRMQLMDNVRENSAIANTAPGAAMTGGFGVFERLVQIHDIDRRMDISLFALQQIGDIAKAMPGRKSLIWVTGGVPISITPSFGSNASGAGRRSVGDPTTGQAPNAGSAGAVKAADEKFIQFEGTKDFSQQIQKVSLKLAEGRVAVYPILITTLNSGMSATYNLQPGQEDIDGPNDHNDPTGGDRAYRIFSARATAEATGGRATFNSNNITGAIKRAVADGYDYYTLSFVPADKNFDGSFRKIEVRTTAPGVTLRYRPGYVASREKDAASKERLQQALNMSQVISTELGTAGKLRAGGHPELELRVALNGLTLAPVEGGKYKASLLVGYVAAPWKGAPLRSIAPVQLTLTEHQLQSAREKGIPLTLRPQIPAGKYALRAGVLDEASKRVGTVDVDTVPQPERAVVSTEAPNEIDGQPLLPEMGELTPNTYTSLYFGLRIELPIAAQVEQLRLPIMPQGKHALLAMRFAGVSGGARGPSQPEGIHVGSINRSKADDVAAEGTLAIFSAENETLTTTDPIQAAKDEAAQHPGNTVQDEGNGRVIVCTHNRTGCTLYIFLQRRGQLVKIVASSDDPVMYQRIAGAAATASSPYSQTLSYHHLPKQLYTGPTVPTADIQRALESRMKPIDAGQVEQNVYRNPQLHLEYGIPRGWSVMPIALGSARFEQLRSVPVEATEQQRQRAVLQACSQPLLHIVKEQPAASSEEPSMLSLYAISPACLNLSSPRDLNNPQQSAKLADELATVYDFGDVRTAHQVELAGLHFISMEGTVSATSAETPLKKRGSQTVFLTSTGDKLLAWFLYQHSASSAGLQLPAASLHIDDARAGVTKTN